MCLGYARRLSIHNIAYSDGSTQNHRYMAETTNLKKKNLNFPKNKYMLSILILTRTKNSYGGYPTDFFPGPTKTSSCPQLLENIPKYTKKNQIKSN
jgi:hypothetical protein